MNVLSLGAHDLVWCDSVDALEHDCVGQPSWLGECWHPGLPLVVRRARSPAGLLPVGLRGPARSQRHAAWLHADRIVRRVSPQQLARARGWRDHPRLAELPALMSLIALAPELDRLRLDWGITGSAGFELASGQAALRPQSDLDLSIRCAEPLVHEQAYVWFQCLGRAHCRVDVQLETPHGAVALNEWLRGGRCLLKTDQGPLLVDDPWMPAGLEECVS